MYAPALPQKDNLKNTANIEQFEIADPGRQFDEDAIEDEFGLHLPGITGGAEDHSGWRRILKKNPSTEFCREVIKMNDEELDPTEVKKVSLPSYA